MELPQFEIECPKCLHKNLVKLPKPHIDNDKDIVLVYFIQENSPECQECHQVQFKLTISEFCMGAPGIGALPFVWLAMPAENKVTVAQTIPSNLVI